MKYNPDEVSAHEYASYPTRIALSGTRAVQATGSASCDVNASAGCSKRGMPDYRGRDARITSSLGRY